MADDLGIGDIGVFGQEIIQILNIDWLVAEGIKFIDYYVGILVCVFFCCVLMMGIDMGRVVI